MLPSTKPFWVNCCVGVSACTRRGGGGGCGSPRGHVVLRPRPLLYKHSADLGRRQGKRHAAPYERRRRLRLLVIAALKCSERKKRKSLAKSYLSPLCKYGCVFRLVDRKGKVLVGESRTPRCAEYWR